MTSVAKLASILILLCVTFVFGILPLGIIKLASIKVKNSEKIQYVISLMNCVGGGVFLGTCFLHLIQESIETVEKTIDVDYPLGGVLIGVGFFIVLGLEHVVGILRQKKEIPSTTHVYDYGSVKHPPNREHQSAKAANSGTESDLLLNSEEGSLITSISQDKGEKNEATEKESPSEGILHVKHKAEKNASLDDQSKTTKRIRTLMLVLALSFHMVFEGMAIGLQSTEFKTWTLMAAVAVHKVIVTLTVCLKMKEDQEENRRIILTILGLAVVSPIGVATGLGISESGSQGSTQEVFSGVLQSLAAGTFVYVTFFEILQKEVTNGYSLIKVALTLVGFGVMAGVKFIDED